MPAAADVNEKDFCFVQKPDQPADRALNQARLVIASQSSTASIKKNYNTEVLGNRIEKREGVRLTTAAD